MKKILALTLGLMLIFSTVSFAAVSSSRSKAPSRPSTSTSVSSPNSSTKQAAPSSPSSGYKPPAPSSSYSDKAPASQAKPGTQTQQQPQQSSGGFWRSAGLFGGGMLLGSLFGNAFGFNPLGGMGSMLGLLSDILILAVVILGIRYVWNRFRNNNERKNM